MNRYVKPFMTLLITVSITASSLYVTADTKTSTTPHKSKAVVKVTPKKGSTPKKAPITPKKLSKQPTQKVSKQLSAKPVVKKLPKLLDLGSTSCIPCKMMAPILEELTKQYKGKLDVVFIDVWKEKEIAEKYSINSIPTQIFFDANGKEVYRHVGYWPKDEIIKTFRDKGIKLDK